MLLPATGMSFGGNAGTVIVGNVATGTAAGTRGSTEDGGLTALSGTMAFGPNVAITPAGKGVVATGAEIGVTTNDDVGAGVGMSVADGKAAAPAVGIGVIVVVAGSGNTIAGAAVAVTVAGAAVAAGLAVAGMKK